MDHNNFEDKLFLDLIKYYALTNGTICYDVRQFLKDQHFKYETVGDDKSPLVQKIEALIYGMDIVVMNNSELIKNCEGR